LVGEFISPTVGGAVNGSGLQVQGWDRTSIWDMRLWDVWGLRKALRAYGMGWPTLIVTDTVVTEATSIRRTDLSQAIKAKSVLKKYNHGLSLCLER
jgi:hypothetical protein